MEDQQQPASVADWAKEQMALGQLSRGEGILAHYQLDAIARLRSTHLAGNMAFDSNADESIPLMVEREPSFRPTITVVDSGKIGCTVRAVLLAMEHHRKAIIRQAEVYALAALTGRSDLVLADYDAMSQPPSVWDLKAQVRTAPRDEAATPNPARRLAPAELLEARRKQRGPRKGSR